MAAAQSNVTYAQQQYQQPVYISGDGQYVTGQQPAQTQPQVVYVTAQPNQYQTGQAQQGYPVTNTHQPQVVVKSLY